MARQITSPAPIVESVPNLVTVAYVGELFHASAVWTYERIADGDFESIKANGKRLITGASVVAYIERKKREKEQPELRTAHLAQSRQAKRAEREARPRVTTKS